jgi:hypothetical protein
MWGHRRGRAGVARASSNSNQSESQSRSLVAALRGFDYQNAVTTAVLARRALRLECLTIGWNAAEAGVALSAGIGAGSITIGFGLDSVIEVFAACVVVWQLRGAMPPSPSSSASLLIRQ